MINRKILFIALAALLLQACSGAVKNQNAADYEDDALYGAEVDREYQKMCVDSGYEWMLMKPTENGKIHMELDSCWGCMVEGIEHVCGREKFRELTGK